MYARMCSRQSISKKLPTNLPIQISVCMNHLLSVLSLVSLSILQHFIVERVTVTVTVSQEIATANGDSIEKSCVILITLFLLSGTSMMIIWLTVPEKHQVKMKANTILLGLLSIAICSFIALHFHLNLFRLKAGYVLYPKSSLKATSCLWITVTLVSSSICVEDSAFLYQLYGLCVLLFAAAYHL